jgi:putative glycoside hydrolase with GxGYxYP motif/GxGYxY motif-containing protein
MAALTLAGMQGTINRRSPCVFLDWYEPLAGASAFWASLLAGRVSLEEVGATGTAAVALLYQRFADRFTGAVVYDPQVPDSINVATMIAALEDRVILAPQQLGAAGMPAFASVTDLREHGWVATEPGKLALYQWVYDNLWPSLDRRLVGVISPGPPTSVHIDGGGPDDYYPLGLAGRDYLVALRAAALWLDPNDGAQAALLDRFLADAPAPIPVTGAYGNDELATTRLISRHGDWDAALDWPNVPLTAGNVTALAAIDVAAAPYERPPDAERILATLGTAPVVTLFSSDGDNLGYQLDRGFHGDYGFPWPDVQGHRFAWTTNATLIDLAPFVWSYYLQSASQVGFIAGFSGAGYIYPSQMSPAQLGAYLDRTAVYHQAAGLRTVWIDDRYDGSWETLAPVYHARLAGSGYLGAILGAGGAPWGFAAQYAGAPAPAVVPMLGVPGMSAAEIAAELLSHGVGDVPIRVAEQTQFLRFGEIVDDATAPGGRAARFPATLERAELVFGTPGMTLLPGAYTISLSAKVAQRGAAAEIGSFYVATQNGDLFHELGRLRLHGADFTAAGQWQTFTFPLTLDEPTSHVQLRIEYVPGTTDLSVATLEAKRAGVDPLPVYAPILISLVAPGPKRDLASLPDALAAAGLLVVTPDEMLASLNPEFMIAFAEPRLGADSAALAQARAQLAAGKYLDALLTVRAALAAQARR